jgi:NADPH2:quinone reductase
MFAVVQHEFGPPETLRHESVEDPKPGPGQVRIAVRAAGVHFLDLSLREGRPGPLPVPELPVIGGREVAGIVDALGPDTDPAWLGRRVVAYLGPAGAGYAELAVVDAGSLHPLADATDDAAAVAMIGTGRTAFAILDDARLTSEDVVVITSAAGGIGALLVQAALDVGAVVVGAAGGAAKVDLVRQLGASVALDYDLDDWGNAVRSGLDALSGADNVAGGGGAGGGAQGVTVVLDGVGGIRGRAALELLSPGGRILFYGWSSGEPTALNVFDLVGRGISAASAVGVRLTARPGGLRAFEDRALAALESGRLVPLLTRFPLAEAAAAHTALANRETVGKVVLIP